MHELDQTEPEFIEALRASSPSVLKVAEWIRRTKGIPVTLNPTFERDDPANRFDYSDQCDLSISQTIQVKQRPDIDFRSKEDFPFNWPIVDATHNWDKPGRARPVAYYICNASLTGALRIDTQRTFRHWRKTDRFDGKKQKTCHFYECPLQLCTYVDLTSSEPDFWWDA